MEILLLWRDLISWRNIEIIYLVSIKLSSAYLLETSKTSIKKQTALEINCTISVSAFVFKQLVQAYIEIPVNRFIQSWENKFACDAIYIMLIERNCMSK